MDQQNDEERVKELRNYSLLDTKPEEAFDRITRIAQTVLKMPIALISLVDTDRQWFKSRQGTNLEETPRDVSFCTYAIQKDQPFIVHDALNDDRFTNSPLVTGSPGIRFYAGVPLKTKTGNNMGTLCVMDKHPRELGPKQIEILRDLARIVVDEIELRSIAQYDCLTGLHLRTHFMEKAEQEMEHSRQFDTNFSIIALDIDNFKAVNANYGHACGDLVLARIASICRAAIGAGDTAARIEGEEFFILLPGRALSEAVALAEHIRSQIENLVVEDGPNQISVTTSFGVADRKSCSANNINTILNAAEDQLFEAKSKGYNVTMPTAA